MKPLAERLHDLALRLESEKDVDEYADILRDELKKLIKEGKRVRIG